MKTKYTNPEKETQKAIKNVILIEKEDAREVYGSLSEICDLKGYVYNTLVRKKFPFDHDGWKFSKIPFRKETETNSN
jgi:hypothetical protein